MIDNKLCELLIQEYYTDVMNFCRAKLMDEEAAKDCAQGGIHLSWGYYYRIVLDHYAKDGSTIKKSGNTSNSVWIA